MKHRIARRRYRGQSSMEFVIVCAALVVALGLGLSGDDNVVSMLLNAFKTAYRNFSHAISLPG